MFEELFSASVLTALVQVIMIDLVLAGDNAVVIGLAAAGLPKEQRGKVILIGIIAATVLRIVLALMTTQLLQIVGLLLAGGILLLWVSWKMWRELRHGGHGDDEGVDTVSGEAHATGSGGSKKTFKQAVWQIVIADLSMSLDNVLAVGGAAREHPWVLIFGLALSIALMGLAAAWIAQLLQKHRWIGFAGLAIIVYVAIEMMWRGWNEVAPLVSHVPAELAVLTARSGVPNWLPAAGIGLIAMLVILVAAGIYRRQKSAG
jgi:YjbE family integral membrane protein